MTPAKGLRIEEQIDLTFLVKNWPEEHFFSDKFAQKLRLGDADRFILRYVSNTWAI